MIAIATLAPWITPQDATKSFVEAGTASPPSSEHWLGTDENAKDVLSRTIVGARLSLLAGGLSVLVAVLIGAPAGAIAGLSRGIWDTLIMRTIDVALAFPSILIALLVATATSPGWPAVIIAVGLINVPILARQIRATVLSVREHEYVLASVAMGATSTHILVRQILPALISPIMVLATLGLGTAILEVAGLSFLGVSGDPTVPEWGSMLKTAKDYLFDNICYAIGPAVAITTTILGFYLLSDALREKFEPKRRS